MTVKLPLPIPLKMAK
ncbi:carbon starvation CstA family protein, partial [Yersinia pestis PY-08]